MMQLIRAESSRGILPIRSLGCIVFLLFSKGALAFWEGGDPLHVNPPILKEGAALPDGVRIQCPPPVDLNQALSLDDVIDLALCNSPQIKQDWASIKIQAAALGEARSAYLPKINASISPQQTQVNYPQYPGSNSITNGRMGYANLTWRLFDFGGRAANRASSNYLLEAALASHNASLQQLMAKVIQAYFDVLTAKANVQAKEEASALAKFSLEATIRREQRGVFANSDTLQAKTALAKAQLADSRAEGDYRKSLASLIFLMGLPSQAKIIVQESSQDIRKQKFQDLDAWLIEAEHQHPAIKAAKAKWQSSIEKVTATRSEALPSIDFMGNFYQNGYPNQGIQPTKSNTTTVGLTINLPIFEGFGSIYKVKGVQAQADLAQAQMIDTENQILTELVKSHADAVSSLLNLESSQKLRDAAKASVDSVTRRYNQGAADILELLNAQSALAEAHGERIRCLAEWRSARLRLFANAGLLWQGLEKDPLTQF